MNELITKFLRHGLAAFAGWLMEQGIQADASSSASIIAALIVFGISALWSFYRKTAPDAGTAAAWREMAAAIAQQLVAALAGYLQARGAVGVDAADPVAVILFSANLAVSKIARRDGVSGKGNAALGQWTGLILICGLMLGCTTAQWKAIGKSAALMAAQMALGEATKELRAELLKPDPDKGKLLALEFGVWLAEEKLREVASRPVNPEAPALPTIRSAKAPVNVLLPPVIEVEAEAIK